MLIKLIRTGGLLPLKKQAEANVDWSEQEMSELIQAIRITDEAPGNKRDDAGYLFKYNAETFLIDFGKIPAKYKKTFDHLKDNLKTIPM